eukprot:SAG31_NODE_7609_length_1642_cov_1.185353_2_plen_247_part_00
MNHKFSGYLYRTVVLNLVSGYHRGSGLSMLGSYLVAALRIGGGTRVHRARGSNDANGTSQMVFAAGARGGRRVIGRAALGPGWSAAAVAARGGRAGGEAAATATAAAAPSTSVQRRPSSADRQRHQCQRRLSVGAHPAAAVAVGNAPGGDVPKPLTGKLVLSMEQAVAAPYLSCRLADAGARVIKVERTEGDFARRYDSFANGVGSSYFVGIARISASHFCQCGCCRAALCERNNSDAVAARCRCG